MSLWRLCVGRKNKNKIKILCFELFTSSQAECQVDGRCLVTQKDAYDTQYAVCCKIDYNPFDFDYDDRTGMFTLKAGKSAPNVVTGAKGVVSGDVSLATFDEQCQLKN